MLYRFNISTLAPAARRRLSSENIFDVPSLRLAGTRRDGDGVASKKDGGNKYTPREISTLGTWWHGDLQSDDSGFLLGHLIEDKRFVVDFIDEDDWRGLGQHMVWTLVNAFFKHVGANPNGFDQLVSTSEGLLLLQTAYQKMVTDLKNNPKKPMENLPDRPYDLVFGASKGAVGLARAISKVYLPFLDLMKTQVQVQNALLEEKNSKVVSAGEIGRILPRLGMVLLNLAEWREDFNDAFSVKENRVVAFPNEPRAVSDLMSKLVSGTPTQSDAPDGNTVRLLFEKNLAGIVTTLHTDGALLKKLVPRLGKSSENFFDLSDTKDLLVENSQKNAYAFSSAVVHFVGEPGWREEGKRLTVNTEAHGKRWSLSWDGNYGLIAPWLSNALSENKGFQMFTPCHVIHMS